MSIYSQLRKVSLAAGAVILVTGAAIAGTAASASAAAHTFKICAYGNYTAYAAIPQQGGIATRLASPGHCQSIGINKGTTYAKVWGRHNSGSHAKFYVGEAHFSASKGWSGAADGTTTRHSLHKFS
jgi:hypothetical protein